MTDFELEKAIQQYHAALEDVVQTLEPLTPLSQPEAPSAKVSPKIVDSKPAIKNQSSPAQVLRVLIARDRVNSILEILANSVNFPLPSGESLEKINQLDERLRKQVNVIAPLIESANLRASFHPDEKAWWWFLEVSKTQWSDRFDWLWSGVSVTCLTVSLGLIGDISPRFLTGVPDAFGAVAVSTQSILTLLVAGGALTKIGQESLRQLLKTINIPEKYWHELGAFASFLVVLGLFSFRQYLPQIATNFYTNPGIESRKKGDWSSADEQFNRAIKLNADDAQAHFQLGNLYEDMQMVDKARPEYQLAIQGGIIGATNNLARLNIFKKDYSGAVSLLLKALDTDKKQPLDSKIKHTVLKNLGWARLMQKNYPDAEAKLLEAIDLQSTLKLEKYDIADVYCLLAQVKEAQGDKKGALLKWKTCNQYANITIPEQDEWATMAQKRLIPKETK
ncbi:tetratricopeptide TPR_2 (plasmid) [Cylindrospermum sp. NIES-4074]|nr:tetratricopeptide TPR_2 [Cylindrospermum sp. NIES-4074]